MKLEPGPCRSAPSTLHLPSTLPCPDLTEPPRESNPVVVEELAEDGEIPEDPRPSEPLAVLTLAIYAL